MIHKHVRQAKTEKLIEASFLWKKIFYKFWIVDEGDKMTPIYITEEEMYIFACVSSKDSDQPVHSRSLNCAI